ncbi:hypothetical protein HF1_06730 [Mycoplasma haemofelis str. Langford 1]|nr:hypothetical protein [Mycoplasma haemofelis]CBY92681.1 hypothetical protein HF1_06730 [Mycoplasma haemofelis str. Langford 1]
MYRFLVVSVSNLKAISGVCAAAIGVAVIYGLDAWERLRSGEAKLLRFRQTTKKVNDYLSSNQRYSGWYVLADPEHKIWDKKFKLFSAHWNSPWENYGKIFPMEARKSKEAMRDFCFRKIEENADDTKDESNVYLDQVSDPKKGFWDLCLDSKNSLEEAA